MKAIRLKRMDEDEYPTYRDAAVRGYAEDKQRSGDWVSRDALTLSLQALHRYAPSGLQTPGQHFFTVHDAATDAKVGWLWYQVRDDGLYRSAFLCDIMIFDEYQRQGYGTACLAELDNQARELGIRASVCTSSDTTRRRWSCTSGAGTRSRTTQWRKTCRSGPGDARCCSRL